MVAVVEFGGAAEAMAVSFVSFWESSGSAWKDGLGCLRGL
jgi:hypothetical protein